MPAVTKEFEIIADHFAKVVFNMSKDKRETLSSRKSARDKIEVIKQNKKIEKECLL